jgi:hypothetical protein
MVCHFSPSTLHLPPDNGNIAIYQVAFYSTARLTGYVGRFKEIRIQRHVLTRTIDFYNLQARRAHYDTLSASLPLYADTRFSAMATSAEQSNMASDPIAGPSPRKFKASELPLPSATRAAIESLAHSFKKEGAYDSIRKQVWDKFEASVCRTTISNCHFFLPSLIFLFFLSPF